MKKTQKPEVKDRRQKSEVRGQTTDDRSQKTEVGTRGGGRYLLPAAALFLLVVGALTAAAYARNSIYPTHVTLWAEVARRSPDKRRAHENYGQALSTAGRLDEALKEFQTVMALPDDGSVPMRDLYREIGVVQFRMGLYDESISSWQTGLRHAPNDPSLLNNLSVVLMQTGRYEEAAAHAELALSVDPFMPQALNAMGQVYMIRKDYEKAFDYFNRAIEREPDISARYWNAALALEQAGKYELALQYVTIYLDREPDPGTRQQAYGFIEHVNKKLGR